nr:replicase [Helleborus mosaic virus]
MALTYRSPIEDVLTSFTSVEQSQISSTAVSKYRANEIENFDLFNYHLSPKAKEKLFSSGIYLSPFSAMAHSHPVCKTLENYFLYKVLPNHIDNTFYLVGIKKHKVEFLKRRDPKLKTVEVINRYVTSMDKLRYGSDFTTLGMDMPSCSGRQLGGFSSDSISTLVPAIMKQKARALFLHDEIHYWSRDDLFCFLDAVRPGCLLATMVFPPEVLAGSKVSLNKWCYDFDIIGKELFFYPDGVRTEGYIQPLYGGDLLKSKRLVMDDGTIYCVDLLHSKFCHHLIAITRGQAMTQKARCFSNFEAISSKHLGRLCKNVTSTFPISHITISKIYRYLRTLLKPDVQSAMAKLGQLVPEPSGFEIKFIQEFAKFVIAAKAGEKFLCPDFFKDVKNKGLMLLPNVFARLFGSVRAACLDDFVADLREFTFQVDLVDLHRGMNLQTAFLDFIEEIPSGVDPDAIDAEFDGSNKMARKDIMTYGCEILTNGACETKYVLEVNEWTYRRLLIEYIEESFMGPFGLTLNLEGLKEMLTSLVERHPWGYAFSHLCHGREIRTIMKKVSLLERRTKQYLFNRLRPLTWFMQKPLRRYNLRFIELFDRKGEVGTAFSQCLARACAWEGVKLRRCLDFDYTEGYMNYQRSNRTAAVKPFWLCDGRGTTPESAEVSNGMIAPEIHRNAPIASGSAMEGGNSDGIPRLITLNDVRPQGTITLEDVRCADAEMTDTVEEARALRCTCGITMDISKMDLTMVPSFEGHEALKGRKGSWYSVDGTDYKYSGGSHKSRGWPDWLKNLIDSNEQKDMGYNCVLDQEYEQGSSIPFHNDDESCFEKGAPILTINVTGTAFFSIKGRSCFGAEFLNDGEAFTMPPGFQGTHKHSVSDCSAKRRSLTFRVLKSIAGSQGVGPKWNSGDASNANVSYSEKGFQGTDNFNKVDVPGDGDCFWHSVGFFMGLNGSDLKTIAKKRFQEVWTLDEALEEQMKSGVYAERESIIAFCEVFNYNINVHCPQMSTTASFKKTTASATLDLLLLNSHYMALVPKNDCVLKAMAKCLGRRIGDIIKVVHRPENQHIAEELLGGEGLASGMLEDFFGLFDVRAEVVWDGEGVIFNEGGRLKKAFTINDDHMECLDKTPETAMKIGVTKDMERFNPSSLAILKRAGTEIAYNVEIGRAELISKSFLQGDTGAISSSLIDGAADLTRGLELRNFKREITAIMGTFGAGKSTLFKDFFKKCLGKHVTFVSPRKGLADDFKRDILGMKGKGDKSNLKERKVKGSAHWGVYTFEIFLRKMKRLKEGQVIIIDEIQLYPPCYLDLVLMSIPESIKVYVVGDPCQSDYHSERDCMIFEGVQSDIMRALDGVEYSYNTVSRRFRNAMFNGRLPCNIELAGLTHEEPYMITDNFDDLSTLSEEKRSVFLVPGFEEKKIVKAHFGDIVTCMTFGESTGRTFKSGVILVTLSSRKVSERRWVTALSRFSDNLVFMNLLGVPNEQMNYLFDGRVLAKFLTGSALVSDLYEILPGKPSFKKSFDAKIGKEAGMREEKMAGDPWLKTMIELNQKEDMEMAEIQQEMAQENWFKTHLPRCDLESIRAAWVHKICAKEHREMWIKTLRTEQFTDEHSKNRGAILTNAAERFETIYPRHRNGDTATFLMAVKKRMSFSKPAVEKAKLIEAECYGEFLLKKFLSLVPLKPKHDPVMMAAAQEDFFDKKTSKSSATIANHAGRSCRDWLIDVAFIFSKSQLCTKYEKRFVNAKAAQSIVCFQHSVLCRFAPYMRYIEKKMNEVLPSKFYVHSGKGLDELNEWVLKNDFTGVCTESDYEAFDASQDQYIMAFELAIMKYLGIPRDLIEDYKYIKTHLGSKLGNFAIMRFSGEASTFLFNTMANMLFTFLRYELTGKEAICFAGDDMCASRKLRTTTEHEGFLSKLKLKAKVAFTKTPTFCGWNLTHVGIFKKPQLVLERICIAKELNNLGNCIDNYALEVAFAYKLGESATCLMNEEELENHYQCVRTIVQNKHLIKSEVIKVYEKSQC